MRAGRRLSGGDGKLMDHPFQGLQGDLRFPGRRLPAAGELDVEASPGRGALVEIADLHSVGEAILPDQVTVGGATNISGNKDCS